MKRMVCLAVIALCMSVAPGSAAPLDHIFGAQASPETVGTPRDPGARAAEMQALQQHLAGGRVAQAQNEAVVVQLTAAERNRIDVAGSVEKRYLVGLAKPLAINVNFKPASSLGNSTVDLNWGAARGTENGGFVWTAAVRSPAPPPSASTSPASTCRLVPGCMSTTSRARPSGRTWAAA